MSSLHEEFRTAINDGDDRLRDQIQAASASVEALSLARTERLDAKIGAIEQQLDRRLHAAREYVDAIFDEHRRGFAVAEQEREKAARALREELNRAITAGDAALEDHIKGQIAQINAALISAEKLETQRIGEVKAMVEGVQREVSIAFAASETAIAKAEIAAEKRFESVNEFRAQLADQVSTFLPRETFDSVVGGWTQWRENIDRQLNTVAGADIQQRRHSDRMQPWMIWTAGGLLTIAITVVIVAVNLLTAA